MGTSLKPESALQLGKQAWLLRHARGRTQRLIAARFDACTPKD